MLALSVLVAIASYTGSVSGQGNPHSQGVGRGQELQQLYELIETQAQQIQQLTARLDALSPESLDLQSKNAGPNTVEFSLTVKAGEPLLDVAVGSVIKFNHVINNRGGGYDETTGVFTAPSSGTYLFTYFVTPYRGAHVNILFQLNGNTFTQAVSEPRSDSHELTGGNAVILHLDVGDEVWLTPHENDVSLRGSFTSFSGIMVQRT